ncbi:hypothetical protein [Paenibacillus oleatilyticus]|uniref:hypothetical protein n=1 Tax=Paenibacillus oleatilyticus TaxID=2594886 RepID=UPI001C1FD35E|nr:hypothetical protein [Paenibacillus oleatilyticus]MBU7315952.1 hypothetical protein [Paenibacillus oleatilyticus]
MTNYSINFINNSNRDSSIVIFQQVPNTNQIASISLAWKTFDTPANSTLTWNIDYSQFTNNLFIGATDKENSGATLNQKDLMSIQPLDLQSTDINLELNYEGNKIVIRETSNNNDEGL